MVMMQTVTIIPYPRTKSKGKTHKSHAQLLIFCKRRQMQGFCPICKKILHFAAAFPSQSEALTIFCCFLQFFAFFLAKRARVCYTVFGIL